MLKTDTKEIDGARLRVTQLPYTSARKTLVRLTKLLGPALVSAASLGQAALSAGLGMGPALGDFFDRLTDEELEHFAKTFGQHSQIMTPDGTWVYLDAKNRSIYFAGRLMLFFRWLEYAIEVNYDDFLAVLKGPKGDDQGQEDEQN